MKNIREHDKSFAGLAIPAGLLTGMGFGFLYHNVVAGLFIGLGSGFVVMLILKMLGK